MRGSVARNYRVHVYFVAMVRFRPCGSLPPPWRTLTGYPRPLRAEGTWLASLTGRAMMYPEAQKVGGQNEGVWRSQNDCRPQAEGQRAQSLQSVTV